MFTITIKIHIIKNKELKIIAEKMKISHIKAYQEGYLDIILAEINEKMQK